MKTLFESIKNWANSNSGFISLISFIALLIIRIERFVLLLIVLLLIILFVIYFIIKRISEYYISFRRITISTKLIVILLFILFLVGYFVGLNKFLMKVLKLPSTTVGSDILSGLILSGIIGLIIGIYHFMKRRPITISMPVSFEKRFSQTELEKNFEFSESCKILKNGFLAKGDKKFENSIMKYKYFHPILTVTASFKAKVINNRHQYWRYGIDIRDKNNKRLALFHLDSDDYIVLYIGNNLFFQNKYKMSFANRDVNLKVCIFKENNTRFISCFLDNNLIICRQKICEGILEDYTVWIGAWSKDDEKDHNVEIYDIWIDKKA